MMKLTKKEQRRKDAYPNTKTFEWYNTNPKGKLVCDCVVRAISKATNKSWYDVTDILTDLAKKEGSVLNDKRVYDKYLTQNGFIKEKQPRKSDNTKYTGDEFAQLHKKGVYLLNMANHLTVCVDGKIYDTWNCGYKTVGNYWRKG